MKLRKTIRLLLTFYKSFFFFSFLMTLIGMGLFWEYGMSIFPVLFWLKVSTLSLTVVFIRSYKSKEFYYYQNLGLSPAFLWISTLSFDFCCYLLLLGWIHLTPTPPTSRESRIATLSCLIQPTAIPKTTPAPSPVISITVESHHFPTLNPGKCKRPA